MDLLPIFYAVLKNEMCFTLIRVNVGEPDNFNPLAFSICLWHQLSHLRYPIVPLRKSKMYFLEQILNHFNSHSDKLFLRQF